jgi:hypothetical protein
VYAGQNSMTQFVPARVWGTGDHSLRSPLHSDLPLKVDLDCLVSQGLKQPLGQTPPSPSFLLACVM